MAALRTVLVGHGRIGGRYADDPVLARHYEFATHAQALSAHPAYAWDAVVDPCEQALAAARERWHVTHTARTLEELRERYEPEVAVLATPPGERLEAVEALPALRGVLVEKPLAGSLGDAERFVAACAERGLPAQVNLWRRADTTFRGLAAGGLERLIGRPQAVFGVYGNGLLNNGTHLVDFIRMLVGEIEEARAFGRPEPVPGFPADVHLPVLLRLAGGVSANLQPLAFAHYRENGLDIWGERGRLSILQEGLDITVHPRAENRALQGEFEIASDRPQALPSTVGRALYEVYDNLAAAVAWGAELVSPASSALRTEAVVHELVGAEWETAGQAARGARRARATELRPLRRAAVA